jgi:tRNA pseudouridine65 synthase
VKGIGDVSIPVLNMTPLTILFEDEYLVAIDKPAGMIVHAGHLPEGPEWIAMKRLRDQLGRHVYPVHRLDRPTSGVLLFALDQKTVALAKKSFELRNVLKTYHAIVCGIPPESWICETPLRTAPDDSLKEALTSFKRLKTAVALGDPPLVLSLIEVSPQTGRYHQIRRHLLEAGFPIVGDFRYAGESRSFQLGERLGTGTRMLLKAMALKIQHPFTGKLLHITAPEDEDFRSCFP